MVKIAGREYPTPLVVGGVVGVVVLVAGQRLLGGGTPEEAAGDPAQKVGGAGAVVPLDGTDVGQFPAPGVGSSYDWWDDETGGVPAYPPASGGGTTDTTVPPPTSTPTATTDPVVIRLGPRPSGAAGYSDAVGATLYSVSGGTAHESGTGNVHAWMGAARQYKPNANLRQILSGGNKGRYLKSSVGFHAY